MNRSIIGGGGGSSSGGGGAVTIADGANVTQGAIADAAVTGDNPGSVSAKLRGLTKILADVWDSVAHRINVTVGNFPATQPVSGTVAVNNFPATQPVSLAAAIDVLDRAARLLGHVTVDNFPATQPVSLAAAVDVSDRAARLVGHVTVDAITPPALTKGTQGATGYSVQDLKDAGRTPVILTLDNIAGIAAEALATMTINKAGVVTTATSYTVTAGKTFRITSMAFSIVNPSTTIASGRVRVRSAGAVVVGSPIFCALATGSPASLANAAGVADISYPDGVEIAGGQQVGISHIESSAIASGVSVCVTGFEY